LRLDLGELCERVSGCFVVLDLLVWSGEWVEFVYFDVFVGGLVVMDYDFVVGFLFGDVFVDFLDDVGGV